MYYVRQALWLTLMMCGPIVLFTMITGLLLGFVQAIFQLQDQSFPFAIKLAGTLLILIALGPWIAESMVNFSLIMFSMFTKV